MALKKINNFIITLLFLYSTNSLADNPLDYTWTEAHPVLTSYIISNEKKIFKDGEHLFKHANKYLPYIYKVAEKNEVPKEIAVVAAIESAFNPKALSHAGALGMWQFMEETAKDMGLSNTERKDWKKSTKAAILYLKWLSKKFDGDYELALLAYNGGIGRVKRAMKNHQTEDPWLLIEKKALPKETRNYLPKFITYVYYYHYIKKD